VSQSEPDHRLSGDSTIRSVAELERAYPDEWILLEIIRDHRDYRRVAGRLLAHSPERTALDGPYEHFRADHPGARVFELFTGDVAPEGVVVIL
jgi:hypothetical protein